MARFAIGDIHGCFDTFQRLLKEVGFDAARDEIFHTGDMVNGGPKSLETVRWFKEHDEVVTSVLGNHDLHLLAVASGKKKIRKKDTFTDLLEAPDREELLDWLRHRPMIVDLGSRVLVHAGLLPDWSIAMALQAGSEVEEMVRSPKAGKFYKKMYGNEPRRWEEAKTKRERYRITINAMTRMRTLKRATKKLAFKYKGTYEKMPANLCAWFDVEEPAWAGRQVICGHWSALGLRQTDRILALDTGCRWGRRLTACRLEDDEIFSVSAG